MRTALIAATLAAIGAGRSLAQTAPAAGKVPSSFVFEEVVTLSPTEVIGPTPIGVRQRVPITGGTFEGPQIKGRVIPGGADWQLKRADGSMSIEADYMIETDDHVQIHVRNIGVISPSADGKSFYNWTNPQFEAPLGRYGWLNDALFVSTLGPAGDKDHPAVRVTIYWIG